MPSSPQTITTRGVFDYLYNSAGKAIVGATVNCTLNFNGSSVTSPIVNLGELQQATVTDQNGFWRFNLVPNDTITPTGTLYTINAGNIASYEISVPSGGADVQSSSILANTPSVLSPAATGLTGPITVTGNETVTGNLTVSGTSTLGSTTTGALTTAAETVGGDLTISSAFRLLFGAAAAKIVPGATSISHRNNADNADNVLITDAGAVTVRNGFTLTAGDAVITAGRLLISAAAAKILGGATSLSLRNNADSADNVLVSDAGLITLRNAISMPPSAGGTVVATNYGTVPVKLLEVGPLGVAQASVRFPTSGSLPTGFRSLEAEYVARSDQAATLVECQIQLNDDTGTNYGSLRSSATGTAQTVDENVSAAGVRKWWISGTSDLANAPATGRIRIPNYVAATFLKLLRNDWIAFETATFGVTVQLIGGYTLGAWNNTAAVTSVTLAPLAGNFVAGSYFVLWGIP